MTEEEQIALAIQMSMNDANPPETPSQTTETPADSTTSAMETEVIQSMNNTELVCMMCMYFIVFCR